VGQPGQVILGTNPAALFDPNPASPGSVLSERVRLPASVIEAAQSQGLTVTYVRTFQDSTLPVPQSGTSLVAIAPAGALGGPFQLLRVQLELDGPNGPSSLAVVAPGDAPRASARISYSGSGILEAEWQVADAASSGGVPLCRPLRRVRRYLGTAGRVRLVSPELPTGLEGLHQVRLRVLTPESAFEPQRIRYAVAANPAPAPVAQLAVHAPPSRAELGSDTPFHWESRPDARAYRLEIFAAADRTGSLPEETLPPPSDEIPAPETPVLGRRLAGVLLPASKAEARLPAFSLSRLPTGTRVLWRVSALDVRGAVVAESAPRELRVREQTR
jgi:hypothetical protein